MCIRDSSGSVYINDLAISSLDIRNYRANLGISFLNQTPFEGTLRENITLGDTSIGDDEIYKIFKIVGLTEFLHLQSKGLNSVIKPEGKQIAYTINKKIILARAIAKKPKIMILEEPIDQLKPAEVSRIVDYLTAPERPWGLVVVSSYEIWKSKCNRRIVIEKGQIKEL